MPFELADHARHLIVQPSDLALDPPESYLFVQDGLIIACGALYALCYIFCMIRTYSDKTYPGADFGAIQFLSLTMAYELFYAFTTTTTRFEKAAFLAWFELDLSFVVLAIRNAHAPGRRMPLVRNIFLFVLSGIALLYVLCQWYPDDREQFTAYWTGILLQFPIGYACLFTLWKDQDTAGHSLEIW